MRTHEVKTLGPARTAPPGEPAGDEVRDVPRELLHGAAQLAKGANQALNGLADAAGATPLIRRNPYGALGASLGVGYVAGGGLFTPTSARLLGLALKLATLPVVRDRLFDVAETALDAVLAKSSRTHDLK